MRGDLCFAPRMDTFNALPEPQPKDFARFMAYVKKETNGCWCWTGASRGKGDYGAFWFGGVQRAHRVIYAWTYGDPGPVELHHKCENHRCVNPAHLELATQGQPHHRNPVTSKCARGHLFSSENTAYTSGGTKLCKQCARDKTARYRDKNREQINAKRNKNRVRVVHEPKPCQRCGQDFQPVRSTAKCCYVCRDDKTDYQREYMREYRKRKTIGDG